jgi:hypothetical protein
VERVLRRLDQEGDPLKIVILGLSALVLATPSPAAAAKRPTAEPLEQRLTQQLQTIRHDRHVLRFFRAHRWLLAGSLDRAAARRQIRIHRAQLAWATRELRETKRALAARQRRELAARVAAASPANAIRMVFGRYAADALEVARCESGLSTAAQNGQYQGLFQMGSSERDLYGHGPTARAQALAAYRYFMSSGRDWSPWGCKPY